MRNERTRRAVRNAREHGRRLLSAIAASALLAGGLVGAGLAVPTAANAADGDPFNPNSPVVFVAQSATGQPTGLHRSVSTDGTYDFTPEGNALASGNYNAIGFNTADNFIYGVSTSNITQTSAPTTIPNLSIVKIGQGGKIVQRVGTSTFPLTQFTGSFGGDGFLYTTNGGVATGNPASHAIYRVNVTTGAIQTVSNLATADYVIADWAFLGGYFWAIDYSSGQQPGTLIRIDPTTGAYTRFPGKIDTTVTGAWGAAWVYGNGNLGFSHNVTGQIAQIAITNPGAANPTFTALAPVPGPNASGNDGTSIPGLPVDLQIVKTGPAIYERGGRISYQVAVTNNGTGVSSGWSVIDVLPAELSNPAVTGDVSFSINGNSVQVNGGALAVGATKTFTISADTVATPDTCFTNTATVLGNELDPVGANNQSSTTACDVGLTIEKISDATADTRPGDAVTYTVTARNTGAGDFTTTNPAVIFDNLAGVLDDAAYNDDATATLPGAIDYSAPLLSWSGALASGASVSISYTVTVGSAGDGTARNLAWRPGDPGDPRPPLCEGDTGVDPVTGEPCAATSFVLPRLTIDKAASRSDLPAVGGTVTYTITVSNPGPGSYTAAEPATFTDDLTDVLDDATFDDGSVTATTGTANRVGTELTWSGVLGAGQSATITYTVTYTGDGDNVLRNTACVPDEAVLPGAVPCDNVRVPGASLSQWKTAQASSDPVVAGSTITYTLHFDNDGQAPATVDAVDDLTHVLDDAVVTAEPVSPDGLTVARDGAEIRITGTVPVGATYTVVYTVTVLPDDERGDSIASNFLLAPGEEPPTDGECTPPDPEAPTCTETPITGVSYTKSVQASETPVRAGTELTYTITATNTGATRVDLQRDDDLNGVLDDATLTEAPSSDTSGVTVTGPDAGILNIRGTLAAGATATITYTVTVKDAGDRGDDVAANFLVPPGTPPGPCDLATRQCTETPIEGYTVSKTADVEKAVPGQTVTYTVKIVNTGAVAYTADKPATFSDDLSGVLDDAVYNGDVSPGGSVVDGTLTWAGPVAVGETVTVTYSVTVGDPPEGDRILTNAVVPTGPGGECDLETGCREETPVSSFTLRKRVDVQSAMAGDTVTYTVTVTNTGASDFTDAEPATFQDDLSGVLDDATYNGDVSAGGVVEGTVLTWSGPLAVGESVDVTYSVTVNDPLTGDRDLANTVTTTVPGSGCDPVTDCETNTPVASYTVTKEADLIAAGPGDVVTYTVTVTNTGDVAYDEETPATFTDDLSGVLDDAVYNDDVSAGGEVTGSTLTWSGALDVGQTVTVTYSVTVDDPVTGDFVLRNAITPTGPGGSCDGACKTATPLASYRVVKTTDATDVTPGETVTYTVTVTNTGQVAYTAEDPASFTDDLSSVLDDATYNGDAASSSGSGTAYTAPVLSWSGPLAVGATVTVTYSVTIDDPATGDRRLSNTVVTPPGSGANCVEGSTDPDCRADVPAASFSIEKSAEPAEAAPGDVVTYTVTVTNTGTVAYTDDEPAAFTDDLSRVLDDASYNDDVSAGGSVVGDTLTWKGPLAVGETLQVTYSVTVDDPIEGDFMLRNVVAPSAPGGECVPGGCVTDTALASYTIAKSADVQDVALGGVVTYTITVTNTGKVAYTDDNPASFEDDLSGVLDDATYNGDATGGAVVDGTGVSWSGAVGVGETATVTYSVTVNQPATGDLVLRNAVTADVPGGGCAEPGGCVTETPIATYRVVKEASTAQARVGDRIVFTVTVTNTGAVDYTEERPAAFADDLSSALAIGDYNDDASSGAEFIDPVLSWEGPLAVGESVEVTYSITAREAGEIVNVVVTPPASGSNCAIDSLDQDCRTTTTVMPPGLAVTGGALWTLGALGGALFAAFGITLAVRRRRGSADTILT
ncbi:DUF11 domain-containing protein [Microbacterium sp. XT11]|uniref:DUF11 domain-containing protein n=1 Tax=Microbacterium sp. XT11 TaxID=367477 RepID=UPI000833514A|nr:DUF11 domain-containing protein [Microbacterium sp. XT11]